MKNDPVQASKRKNRIFRLALLVAISLCVLGGVIFWPQLQPRLSALGLDFNKIPAAEAPTSGAAIIQAGFQAAPEAAAPHPSRESIGRDQ